MILGATHSNQPPLGGCVLKLNADDLLGMVPSQPPLGGCVLKPPVSTELLLQHDQPPLGGCVLKPISRRRKRRADTPSRL